MALLADKTQKRALQPVMGTSFKGDLGGIKWIHGADKMVRNAEMTSVLIRLWCYLISESQFPKQADWKD